MIRCLCCHRYGEPIKREGAEWQDNRHDRPPVLAHVNWDTCGFCGSDMVEEVTACLECKQKPAELDDNCEDCTVAYYRAHPLELDLSDECWSLPHWKDALARIQHEPEFTRRLVAAR